MYEAKLLPDYSGDTIPRPALNLMQMRNLPDTSLMGTVAAIALSVCLGASTASAQFMDKLTKPKVPVPLRHPPGLGLNVKRIAFGQSSGECADQLVDLLTEGLVRSGIDVIDRQHLQAILDEHKFQVSMYLDSTTALQLGRILGPTAFIFVKAQRCTSEQQPLREVQRGEDGSSRYLFISRTRAFVRGSVQTVDLTTGRVFSAQSLEASPVRDNRSYSGQPEFPPGVQLIDESLRALAEQARRMYVPWTETKEVYFYNDGDCGLKQAYELLKAGSVDAALERSQANLGSCREQPKVKQSTLSHALYNAGVMQMLALNYDQAKKYLNEASSLKDSDIVNDTLAECETAEKLARAMQQVEARSVAMNNSRPAAPAPETAAAPSAPPAPTVEQRLRALGDLFQKGLITKDDFDKRKAEILKEI